jgi:hypothetical protein
MSHAAEPEAAKLDRKKYRLQFWSIVLALVSVVVAGYSIYFNAQLNALDLTLKSPDLFCTQQGKILYHIDPEDCQILLSLPPSRDVERELAALIIEHPEKRDAIVATYKLIYSPKAHWIDDVAAATSGG